MESIKGNLASSETCENGTPHILDAAEGNMEHNDRLSLIKLLRERNESMLKRLKSSSLLQLCEENSVGDFHLIEECRKEHCLIAKQVYHLVTDLVTQCSEIDARFEGNLLWTGSSAEGTKMWLPDEFDFLMELEGLRGNSEYNNRLTFSSDLLVKKECQELWSSFCFNKDSADLSPLKLKDHFTNLVKKAASLLDRNRYNNIRFESDRYASIGMDVTKVGISITVYWRGNKYKNLKINIDLTIGIPLVLNEKHLSRLEEHSVGKLLDNQIHFIPHTKHGGIWRPSFSLAEFQMLKNLTTKQLALYKCLKFCRDVDNFNPFFHFDLIPSYYLKMFLFNYLYVENGGSNVKTIERQEFFVTFRQILIRLIEIASLPGGFGIPHFFVRYNLIANSSKIQWCQVILNALENN